MIKSRKQNSTTYPINFLMVDSNDGKSGKTGLTPTVTLSKNGGAFASAAGAVSEIGNGWYSLAGNATDRNTLGELCIHASATGADSADPQYSIVDFDPIVFKPPVTLAYGDVTGNLPANALAWNNGALPTIGTSTLTAQQVWEYATRTLSAFGFSVTLSTAAQNALVAAIELELVNDSTGHAFMQAIADKLQADFNLDDLTIAAIAAATRDAILNRVLASNHDTAGTPGKLLQNADATLALINAVADKYSTMVEAVGDVYHFTANALELAPVGGGTEDDDIAAAVWSYGARTLTGVTGTISWPVLSNAVRQDYITAISNLVSGDLPLGETEKIFAINMAIKTYSLTRPRFVVEDEDGANGIDYLLTLLADWVDGFSVIKVVEYPLDDDEAAVNVLQDDAWQIYQKPTGKCLRFLEDKPSAAEDFRVAYTSLHICTDDACTIPLIDEGAVQMLAAATFCDMLAAYYAQTSDSTIMADSVDHKSKASEYASRARTYRQQYLNHLGIKEGSVAPASVTRDQDTKPSWRSDNLTHPRKFR